MTNDRLRDALLKNGVTPHALAELLEVDPKTVERWITLGRLPYAKYRHRIAALMRETEGYLWPDALSADQIAQVARSEVVTIYPHRASVPAEVWRRLLDGSTEQVAVLVYSGLFLPETNPRLVTALKAKARAGVKVRLLFGDPDGEQVAERGREEGIGAALAGKVRNSLTFYRPLLELDGVEINLHGTTLYNSLYRFDDEMLANTHVYGFPAAYAPVMHLRRLSAGDLFDTYAESYERVWAASRPVRAAELDG